MSRPRILLVEDSAEDAMLLLAALDDALASEVLVVRDGEEAIELLFGRHPKAPNGELPAVVVLDLKMPKLNGLDVLRRVKGDARLRAVPVVILTSSREERDVVDSYAAGCNAYVVKQLDFGEFTAAVRAIGTFWGTLNQPPPGAVHRAPEGAQP